MTARELLSKDFPNACLSDAVVKTLTDNTAHASANSIFVCIKGARIDGHDLAARAYESGCRIFIAERMLVLPPDAVVLLCENTRQMLSRLACRFYGHPSRQMHVIGITGTKGKTTTAQLLSHVLNQNGISCGYIGTNGITYGNVDQKMINTTPDPLTLQSTLRRMKDAGMKAVVVEVSSQALMQARADGTHFETVLFTNLAPDHVGINEHASFEDYKACKKRLFTDFDAQNVIWNADDPHTPDMQAGCSIPRQISCSTVRAADCAATDIAPYRTPSSAGIAFTYTARGRSTPCTLALVGRCNVSNALLATATAAEVFGLDPARVMASLSDCAVRGRSEWISLPNGAAAVIDYAHNGESLRQILTSLREYAPTRMITLFGSVGERSQMRRRDLGKVAAELSDLCILTSDNPGCEEPEQIMREIASAILPRSTPYCSIPDRREAIEYALSITKSGDILLLAGKGHEEYQLIGREKHPFSEREIVTRYVGRISYTAQK